MKLPGRLRSTTLGDLLGVLYRARLTGVLELREIRGIRAGTLHRIHLLEGNVNLVEPGDAAILCRSEARQHLDELFRLDDAEIAFRVARPKPIAPFAQPLQPDEYLHGRPRARDRAPASSSNQRAASPPASRRQPEQPARTWALSLLGLPANATFADIRQAFRKLALMLHPDRHPSATAQRRQELAEQFAEITKAYHALVA